MTTLTESDSGIATASIDQTQTSSDLHKRMSLETQLANEASYIAQATNQKSAASQVANQNDTASSLMMEADLILDDGGESDTLSLADVAEWALDSQQRNQQANAGKARSYSVQLNTRPTLPEEAGESATRRASTAVGRRASGYNPDRDTGSRPGSGLLERRPAMYADKDGVQLRGDKGKARRKSTASQISKPNQINAPITNEWKKSFVVPYTPRHTVTKLVNATIQPPKLELLDVEESRENLKQHKLNRSSLRHRKEQAYRYAGKSQQHTSTPRHVEIHYEDFLPKDLWLEMKPRRFTTNHKHGNHFEIRKSIGSLDEGSGTSGNQSRKEAYVWENPYQIWLMEKTHND